MVGVVRYQNCLPQKVLDAHFLVVFNTRLDAALSNSDIPAHGRGRGVKLDNL